MFWGATAIMYIQWVHVLHCANWKQAVLPDGQRQRPCRRRVDDKLVTPGSSEQYLVQCDPSWALRVGASARGRDYRTSDGFMVCYGASVSPSYPVPLGFSTGGAGVGNWEDFRW